MKFLISLACLLTFQATLFGQAPENWFHQDPSNSEWHGVATEQAYEKLKGKTGEMVVVAVIDSGVDIEHEDLKDVVWVNPGEIAGNGIDDDKNGYVDDVHGWNFIGGANGNVNEDTYEATRLYKKYKYKYENAVRDQLSKNEQKDYDKFKIVEKEVMSKLDRANERLEGIESREATIISSVDAVQEALGDMDITAANVSALEGGEEVAMGKEIVGSFLGEGEEITDFAKIKELVVGELDGAKNYYQGQLDHAYNIDFNPRTIVGDNYDDSSEKSYGNNDVEGPDALHGTHVAGIIAATRNNGVGMNGVADNVKIMSVRTVPNGDERDKDVANAIRYAVDNGASIINMSFGKGFSWDKAVVDEAVKYATKNDVLLVHAAGNSSQNNDNTDNFPNDSFEKKSMFCKGSSTWMEIGALNFAQGENFCAPFSNYGKAEVDLFSPGMQIYATLPDNEYANLQGTSMAAPVVAGVAAILRSYFPELSAEQVKEILESTVTPINEQVIIPGEKDKKAAFSSLSVTGGVVNAESAVAKAMNTKGKRKKKIREKAKTNSMKVAKAAAGRV